ncbi:MAG: phosphodiester glycosidase family protein [Eubacteriales bacterium]
MKKIKFISLLLAALMLASCTYVPEGTEAVTDSDTSPLTEAVRELTLTADYTVIRPDQTEQTVINALSTVRDAMKSIGITPKLSTDWLNTNRGEQPGEYEILIGETNRPESQAVLAELSSKYDYTVRVVGAKVVIIGGCDMATLRAAEYFAELIKAQADGKISAELCHNGHCSEADLIVHLDGETDFSFKTLYEGVTSTNYALSADSKYGQQNITVIEFDPKQSDLYFDVTMGGSYATTLKTVESTVKAFNENNGMGKTAIAAVNGDLWMVTYAHARVLGRGTSYNGYSDAVVKKSMNIPRGFDMYDGEIITSAHMKQETPYEGDFYSFGITDDGEAVLGNPQVGISIVNKTRGLTATADGLNRLPADNALVMYSDRLSANNALDDAFQVIIDCGYDYVVRHGETITGKVTAVIGSGEAVDAELKQNRIVLTARGNKIDGIKDFAVGDSIEISITVTDKLGNNAVWQKMRNAVGGHMPIVLGGRSTGISDSSRYPMTILGTKKNGNVVMITYDGRQSGYAVGLKNCDAAMLCSELGIENAFFLDGGGSASMVQLVDGEYELVNRPSDKNADGSYGKPRTVVNTVILSIGPKKTQD